MLYIFNTKLDIGDIVTMNLLNHSSHKFEDCKCKINSMIFGVSLYINSPFLQVRYSVIGPDMREYNYVPLYKDIHDNEDKIFVLDSEYVIDTNVWVLKQNKNLYTYTIKEAHIYDISWVRDREEDFQDIRYCAKINDIDRLDYFKGTAFAEHIPGNQYIYNTEKEAILDKDIYDCRYERIQQCGGFY